MSSSASLSILLVVALAVSASAQSTASGKKPAVSAASAAMPAFTVAKSGTSPGAQDSDVRPNARTTPPRNAGAAATPANGENAVFRPGDTLDMRVSGIPAEDSGSFPTPITIGADGTINITYITGPIRAAGLTQGQLERAIQQRFIDEKIFRWPTVAINVANPQQQRAVTVGGYVRGPGRQPWAADLTLMAAISAAGGPGDYAGDKINLIRNGAITLYHYKALQKNPADDPKLLPGDQVDLK